LARSWSTVGSSPDSLDQALEEKKARRGRPRLALTVSVAAMLATTPLIGEY
jgi:hypothetical protein